MISALQLIIEAMPSLPHALLVVVLLLAAVGRCADLQSPLVIEPSRKHKTQVKLHVRAGQVSIPLEKKDGPQLYFQYTGRFYEVGKSGPMLPGPMLKTSPGGQIKLTMVNDLGREAPDNASDRWRHTYIFHNPNTTNIHFHGLHSDPRKDNPFKVAPPGETLQYSIRVPRDHEPGLHWYHAHSHGAVYYQLMGGLFGAIDVGEGDFMSTPTHPFRHWQKEVLLIHLYRLAPSHRCDGATMAEMDATMTTQMPSRPRVVDAKGKRHELPPELFLVNGQHRPTVSVEQGVPLLLRMAYAAGSCYVNMSLPAECRFHLASVDGWQMRRTREVVRGWLYFTTATRIGVAVVCQKRGVFPVHHVNDPSDILFYIASGPSTKEKAAQEVAFPILLPKYSPDYLDLSGSQQIYREISFSQLDLPPVKPYYVIGHGEDCKSLRNSSTCFYSHFQGQIGEEEEARGRYHGFVMPLHSVVTARVYGDPTDDRPHPLHFHVNHFKFISFEPRVGGRHENHTMDMYGVVSGQYRDTIPILDGVTVIQWQAATYTGEVVYHCHALHHEDRGMMLSYLVYSALDDEQKTSAGGADGAMLKRRESLHVLLLLLVFLAALVAVMVWRCIRQYRVRNAAEMWSVLSGQRDVGSAGEQIPLLPHPTDVAN